MAKLNFGIVMNSRRSKLLAKVVSKLKGACVCLAALILVSAFSSCSTPKEGLSLREIIEVRAQAGAASAYQNQAVREVRELQQMNVRLDDMLSLLRQRGKQIESVSKVCITTQ